MIVLNPRGETVEVPDLAGTPAQVARARGVFMVELIGADGEVWDLNRGPVQLCAGTKGLFDPPPRTQWLQQTVGVPGSRYTGEQVDEHTMTLPVETAGKTWQEWRDVDGRFLRSLAPNAYSTLRVTAPDGAQVTKPVLRSDVGDPQDDFDPLIHCRRYYPDLAVVAPQPYWQMPDVTRVFTFSAGRSFFRGRFRYLSSGASARTATITNPGDVPVFVRTVTTGPGAEWSVGFGDKILSSTTPLADQARIEMDGRTRSITHGTGARAYDFVDRKAFPVCPPGVEVPVVATMTGYSPSESSIAVTITPLKERPL